MKIEINIKNTENLGEVTQDKINKIQEIFEALVTSGGLTGVKGGKTVLHFGAEGEFMGIELDYWPWRRRKEVR